MTRIGILGSDNSHALAFAKLCNLPMENGEYRYPDVRITAIYGNDDDPKHTKDVAEQGAIEFIAEKPEDFIGKVDAVMVVYRKGSLHVPAILPFVEAGYPVWIDKPIAVSVEDINRLREAVERNNTLVTGGSTLKYNYEVQTLQNKVKSGVLGTVTGGAMNFPGDVDSPYDGLFFYGSHLCEMCLTIFGYDVKSVYASKLSHNNICVIAKYEDKQVCLSYQELYQHTAVSVYGTETTATMEIDASFIYRLGFEKWLEMLRTGRMPLCFDDLVQPVYMLNAIQKSIDEGREVTIDEVK